VRRDPEFFGDKELELVYIAKRLRHALRLEEALTTAGLDYVVATETYHGGIIFRSERVGAFFYLPDQSVEPARKVVIELGMSPYTEG
jgi:hypothetical protein